MIPGAHRPTSRVILHTKTGEILLFKTEFDPEIQLPPRWITPGGGIDPGETVAEAAIRELHEETGLQVDAESLGTVAWSVEGRVDWQDGVNFHTFVDHFFLFEVDRFEPDKAHWTDDEHRDVLETRWWSLSELIATGEPVHPPGLVDRIRNHLQSE